jgi:intracellular sulfur oxidation DsrE/DsrF family protein
MMSHSVLNFASNSVTNFTKTGYIPSSAIKLNLNHDAVIQVAEEAKKANKKMSLKECSVALQACAESHAQHVDLALWLFDEITKSGHVTPVDAYARVVKVLTRANKVFKAVEIFESFLSSGYEFNEIILVDILSALSKTSAMRYSLEKLSLYFTRLTSHLRLSSQCRCRNTDSEYICIMFT